MATRRFEEADMYDAAPLYYDIVFDEDSPLEGYFLEEVQRRHGGARGRRLLEPACGGGRLVAEMARRGYRVTGFDASAPMLRYAAGRLEVSGLEAELLEARMESFELPGRRHRFDLAHCLISTFKYIPDEAGARAHLEQVAAALKPGGLYVLGLHLTDYARTGPEHERWVGQRDGLRVVCNTRTWPADRAARRERLRTRLVASGTEERRIESRWTFRTYDAAELAGLIAAVPSLELAAGYDFTYDLDCPRELDDSQSDIVLVLRRR